MLIASHRQMRRPVLTLRFARRIDLSARRIGAYVFLPDRRFFDHARAPSRCRRPFRSFPLRDRQRAGSSALFRGRSAGKAEGETETRSTWTRVRRLQALGPVARGAGRELYFRVETIPRNRPAFGTRGLEDSSPGLALVGPTVVGHPRRLKQIHEHAQHQEPRQGEPATKGQYSARSASTVFVDRAAPTIARPRLLASLQQFQVDDQLRRRRIAIGQPLRHHHREHVAVLRPAPPGFVSSGRRRHFVEMGYPKDAFDLGRDERRTTHQHVMPGRPQQSRCRPGCRLRPRFP